LESNGFITFGYKVQGKKSEKNRKNLNRDILATQECVEYSSERVWLFGHIPLHSSVAPHSSWKEIPTKDGWKFHGKVEAPWVGTFIEYYGQFHIQND